VPPSGLLSSTSMTPLEKEGLHGCGLRHNFVLVQLAVVAKSFAISVAEVVILQQSADLYCQN